MYMQKISVKTLITGALISLLIMLTGVGLLGYLGEREAALHLDEINQISAQQSSAAARAEANLMEMRVRLERLAQYYANGSEERAADALGFAIESLAVADTRMEALNRVETTPEMERYAYLEAINTAYSAITNTQFRQDLQAGDYRELINFKDNIDNNFNFWGCHR